MQKQEILNTRYGEMIDMITCLAIYNGNVKEKKPKRKYSFDEVLELR